MKGKKERAKEIAKRNRRYIRVIKDLRQYKDKKKGKENG